MASMDKTDAEERGGNMTRLGAALAIVALACVAPSHAQQSSDTVTLKVTAQETTASGMLLLTLESGTTIAVPIDDAVRQVAADDAQGSTSQALLPARDVMSLSVVLPVPLPTDPVALPRIRAKCAEEWESDFRMRSYCENQQREALTALRSRRITAGDLTTIRVKCDMDWTDDFRMRNYCEEQQLKALAALEQ